MTTAAVTPPISLARHLAEVMDELGFIPKNGHNQAQNYDFVRASDVLDTVRTQLALRNIAVSVSVTDVRHDPFRTSNDKPQFLTTVTGELRFHGEGGEIISVGWAGTGADGADKGYFKAVTGGLKYALLSTFLIPTGDDPEGDSGGRQEPPASAPRTAPAPRNVTAGGTDTPGTTGLSAGQRGKWQTFARGQKLSETQARGLLFGLTGKYSSKDLTQAEFDRLVLVIEDPGSEINRAIIERAREDFA